MKRCAVAMLTLALLSCGDSGQAHLGEIRSQTSNPIYYGQTSPTLYVLTAAEENAVVALADPPSGQRFCTGALISPHVVLTAGHCIDQPGGLIGAGDIVIHVGPDAASPLATLPVQSVDFVGSESVRADDIGVLILQAGYTGVPPLPIKRGGIFGILYRPAQAVGYGRTDQSDDNTLRRWTTLDVILHSDNRVIVYGNGQTGVAEGDSGSPLLFDFGDGPQVVGVLSSTGASYVEEAVYASVVGHEDWVQGHVFFQDDPACSAACTNVDCGSVGACLCGHCDRGLECVANVCQEISPGSGGACISGSPPGIECADHAECGSNQICYDYVYGRSECADLCGPVPCATGDPGSFCFPVQEANGDWVHLCVESVGTPCTTEFAICQTSAGVPGYCIPLMVGEPPTCYPECQTVETCPEDRACVAVPISCAVECANTECGFRGNCHCGYCADSVPCENNTCVCQPDCTDKECGADGCGGTCGDCPSGKECNRFARCIPGEGSAVESADSAGGCAALGRASWWLIAALGALMRRRLLLS